MSENFDWLLEEYRTIWHNRLLENNEIRSEEILLEAIKRELLDENSHPRVRKTPYEKFYFAVKRILNAKISPEAKPLLIRIYVEMLEKLIKDV
ncbi:hypothetical protein [Neobacillus fumarioli]|uniref:hypothetical protein n=1 Tax=Neobacillus fumarioli TaxID=105229 RepID=UPI000834458E|nr:hypothetical protein [Neobacillus fumarioli]